MEGPNLQEVAAATTTTSMQQQQQQQPQPKKSVRSSKLAKMNEAERARQVN